MRPVAEAAAGDSAGGGNAAAPAMRFDGEAACSGSGSGGATAMARRIDEAAMAMQVDAAASGGERDAAAPAMGEGGGMHGGVGAGGQRRPPRRGKHKQNGGVRRDRQQRGHGDGE